MPRGPALDPSRDRRNLLATAYRVSISRAGKVRLGRWLLYPDAPAACMPPALPG
jgi:hypothetical protein